MEPLVIASLLFLNFFNEQIGEYFQITFVEKFKGFFSKNSSKIKLSTKWFVFGRPWIASNQALIKEIALKND